MSLSRFFDEWGRRMKDQSDSFWAEMIKRRPVVAASQIVRAGAPDMRCAWPACRRRSCSATTVPGVGTEYVCECCGFRWGGKHGVDAQGRKFERDAKGDWIRVYR